ncbi:hypothetical protein [Shewanella denitrificans]|nr:hypothetical protein [Shewanella denitrificans]
MTLHHEKGETTISPMAALWHLTQFLNSAPSNNSIVGMVDYWLSQFC